MIINHTAIKSKNTAIRLSHRIFVILPTIKSKIPIIAVVRIGVVIIKLSSFINTALLKFFYFGGKTASSLFRNIILIVTDNKRD